MSDDFAGDKSTTGMLQTGGMVHGALETVDDKDWFKLDLKVNHGYFFTPVMANGRVPSLSIWDADANFVMYTTEPGALNTNDLVNPFVPFREGNYYLEIGGTQAGNYRVGMREAPDDAGNDPASARLLTTASPVAGRFDYAFDKDQFRISTVAGLTYTVTVSADSGGIDSASFMRLGVDGKGSSFGFPYGQASVSYSFTADRTGDYLVTADLASLNPPAGGALAYRMSVSAADRDLPKVVAGTGTVDGGVMTVTLDEAVFAGTSGKLTVRGDGVGEVGTWTPGDPRMHISGNTLTLEFDQAGALAPGEYDLLIEGDILVDASGNSGTRFHFDVIDVQGTARGGLALPGQGVISHLTGSASSEDAAVFRGSRADYTVVRDGDGFKVNWGFGYYNTLSDIERVLFTQSSDVVALSLDGKLGQAFRLYTAAFDRAPDEAGLGFWLDVAERGVSLPEMARGFIASKEFADLYGAHPDDAAFVAALYENVLHRPGDAGGVRYWMDALGRGADRGEVLAAFSESTENQDQAVELIGNGIVYTPYG